MENMKAQRTQIEAIEEFGYELSDEQLRLVAGGARKVTAKVTGSGSGWDVEVDIEF